MRLLLAQIIAMEEGVGADLGEAHGRFDFGELSGIGREPPQADVEFGGVIVGEFVGKNAGESDFDGGADQRSTPEVTVDMRG